MFDMSHVTCHMSQSSEAYRWRVCYQRGLPRLVYTLIIHPGHNGYHENVYKIIQKFTGSSRKSIFHFFGIKFILHLSGTDNQFIILFSGTNN